MLRVEDIMTKTVIALRPDMTLEEAANALASHRVSGAPIFDGGRIVGVLSSTDLVEHASDPKSTLVGTVMTPYVLWVDASQSLITAVEAMTDQGVRRMIVLGPDGGVAGIVTATDVLRAMCKGDDDDREDRHADAAVAMLDGE